MKTQAALSAVGKDQPGIVAALAKMFFDLGCNLEESSMTRLKGDFAVLLLISLPDNLSLESLKTSMAALAKQWELAFTLRELPVGGDGSRVEPNAQNHTLVVYGIDHPGIVYKVTQAAADLKVNITDLRTRVTEGKSGAIYSLIMELEIPGGNTADSFREKLEILKKDLKVEVTLTPVEAEEL
jgi:glycine cleavage system transcriptional repressor